MRIVMLQRIACNSDDAKTMTMLIKSNMLQWTAYNDDDINNVGVVVGVVGDVGDVVGDVGNVGDIPESIPNIPDIPIIPGCWGYGGCCRG